jgi:ribosomal protein S18 acetylase RimI-like enzyme
MKIRKATLEDIALLWSFEKEHRMYDKRLLSSKFRLFFSGNVDSREEAKWRDHLRKLLDDRNTLILIAEEDGKPLGYAMALIAKWDDEFGRLEDSRRTGYISKLFVTKRARGRRISHLLLGSVLKWFKCNKISYVSLHVWSNNTQAIEMYRKFGFDSFRMQMRKKI